MRSGVAGRGQDLLSYLELESGRLLGGRTSNSNQLDKLFSKLRRPDKPAQVAPLIRLHPDDALRVLYHPALPLQACRQI